MSSDPTQQPGPDQSQPPTQQADSGQQLSGPIAEAQQPEPYYEYSPYGNGNSPPASGNPYPTFTDPQYLYGASQAPHYGTPLPPLPLMDAVAQLPLQYWKILRKPGARSFAEEAGKAKWNILLVQLIGYTLLAGLLGWLHLTLYPLTAQDIRATTASGVDVTNVVRAELDLISFVTGPGLLFLVPLGFFIYQGIAFGLARAFGGQGSFLTQSYAILLIYVPIGIISIALDYVPLGILPPLVVIALEIYGIVLTVFAMMGAHRLTGGKASATALLPFLGLLLLACCGFFIALFPAISSAVSPQ